MQVGEASPESLVLNGNRADASFLLCKHSPQVSDLAMEIADRRLLLLDQFVEVLYLRPRDGVPVVVSE